MDWISTHDAISLARNMFMHYHALLVVFIISCVLSSTMILCLSSLSLSFSLLVMALKKSIPSKNPILRGSSSSSSTPSNSIQFRDEKHVMTSLKTFLTERFIWNARSFYLTFQTLLYPMHLALKDGLLYVRNPQGVLTCSYRSFTPTCMPSISLYLGLVWYS